MGSTHAPGTTYWRSWWLKRESTWMGTRQALARDSTKHLWSGAASRRSTAVGLDFASIFTTKTLPGGKPGKSLGALRRTAFSRPPTKQRSLSLNSLCVNSKPNAFETLEVLLIAPNGW